MEAKIFKTPRELFEFDDGLNGYIFEPKEFEIEDVLFWHVPDFLENNKSNERLTMLTASEESRQSGKEGNGFRMKRLGQVINYINQEVFDAFDEKVENLWLDEPNRQELIDKAEQLLIRSQYNLGYPESGLYLDFNKFFKILDNQTSFKTAERIIDNNLFLGNMATFYTIHANYKSDFEVCEKAKERYRKTLQLMKNKEVHFALPKETTKFYDYVDENEKRRMVLYQDNDQAICGYGAQFLYEVLIYKDIEKKDYEQEINLISEKFQNNSSFTQQMELKKAKDKKEQEVKKVDVDLKNAKKEISELEESSAVILNKTCESVRKF